MTKTDINNKIKLNKEKIIIIIIFVVAIFSRLYLWPNTINDINCDEAMTALNAKAISEKGKDMYGTSMPVYFEAWLTGGQSALLTYFIAICIKIFGFSIFSIRLPMIIVSIISLFVFYKLIDIVFNNKKITLISLFILAINPWHIMQSVWSLDCNLFPHFMLMSVYLLVKGSKEKKNGLIYISMLFFGITTYTYGISLYVIPIFLIIYMLIALAKREITWKCVIFSAFIVIFVSLPLIIMTILNLLKNGEVNIGLVTIQKFDYFTRTNDMLLFSDNIWKQIVINLKSLLVILIFNQDGLIWNSIKGIGTIYLGSLIFAIIGIIYIIKEKNYGKIGKNAILIWLLCALMIGVFINSVNINRINIIWYPIIILIGFGIYKCYELCNFNKIFIITIIISYIIWFTIFNIGFYTNKTEEIKNSTTWSKGLQEAVTYAESTDKQIIIDNDIMKENKNVIFILYLFDYDFKHHGFIPKEIFLDSLFDYNKLNLFSNNKNIKFNKCNSAINKDCIYITYKSYSDLEIYKQNKVNNFNMFCTISN